MTRIARDTGGNQLTLDPFTLTILGDTEPPTVQIDQPLDGDTVYVYDIITIEVTAIDNVEVASLSFQLDGVPFSPQQAVNNFVQMSETSKWRWRSQLRPPRH